MKLNTNLHTLFYFVTVCFFWNIKNTQEQNLKVVKVKDFWIYFFDIFVNKSLRALDIIRQALTCLGDILPCSRYFAKVMLFNHV